MERSIESLGNFHVVIKITITIKRLMTTPMVATTIMITPSTVFGEESLSMDSHAIAPRATRSKTEEAKEAMMVTFASHRFR